MKVKTFHAVTMQDAIRAIKEELGPDAVILSSKEVHEGGRLLRLFNRPILEVMAAAEDPPQEARPKAGIQPERSASQAEPVQPVAQAAAKPDYAFQETLQSLLAPSAKPVEPRPPQPAIRTAIADGMGWKQERLRRLRGELHDLTALLGASLPPERQALGDRLPAELATCCRALIGQGVRPSTAESMGHEAGRRLAGGRAGHPRAMQDAMHQLLSEQVRVSGPLLAGQGDRSVSLFLGPSGSGKTTAVTKLAAYYRLEEKKSVAIITFDTYRQASVEQLRMYAGVLGVPFASAVSPRQVHDGLRRHAHADVVLIDMPGVGPDDVAAARDLHHLLRDEASMDIHLVAPASMREQDLLCIYDRVKDLPLLRLLFTKLDETASFGTVFELTHQTGVPLSYWSTGQRVPEDLEVAAPDRLATLLLAQHYVASPIPIPRSAAAARSEMPEPIGATGQHER